MEKRKNFTTIAVDKDIIKILRENKKHPRQSNNEILHILLPKNGNKDILSK